MFHGDYLGNFALLYEVKINNKRKIETKLNPYFMESTRLQKISRLLQKELGILFQRESHAVCNGKMVTVTSVRVSPDLGLAKVYISIFPSDQIEETLFQIKNQTKYIRHNIGHIMRNQLRIVPEFEFFVDDSLDYIEKIEKLIKPSKNL